MKPPGETPTRCRATDNRLPGSLCCLLLAVSALFGCSSEAPHASTGDSILTETPQERSLAPFVPTPLAVVERMLELAEITRDDVVYDLGCGDGRIVVEAAKRYGARCVGVDFDLRLCEEARERARREGVSELVDIRHADILETDFSDATVVTLYLLPAANKRLEPKLRALAPGTRIVAHNYGIGDWPPLRTETVWVRGLEDHTVHLWRVGREAREEP